MMPNQEMVLHGLDSCGFYDGIPNICEVTECPYRDDKCACVHELAHDAGLLISELLKAQEPRLITEADFENADEYGFIPVWCEVIGNTKDYWNCITIGALETAKEDGCRYWTSKPSLKQMEETPWE